MAEYVLKISQSEVIEELEKTPSVSEKIAKLDVFICKLEERKTQLDRKRKDLDAMDKLLDEQRKIVANQRKEIDEQATETELILFRSVRQNLIDLSSLPPSTQSLAPPSESSMRQPTFPVPSFSQPATASSRFLLYPPPTHSLPPPEFPVPPPTASWRSNFPSLPPPMVSSGLPFSGPQSTWGPLYGPIPPVQERREVAEPRRVRLEWTEERARSFDDAVHSLGGLFYATPRRVKQAMARDDITEQHISSRLQIFRDRAKRPRFNDVGASSSQRRH